MKPTTEQNSRPADAVALLQGIRGEWRVMPHDDETTAEIHDDLGALCSCEAKFAPLIAAAPSLAASHARLVDVLSTILSESDFGDSELLEAARSALSEARKLQS